MQEKRRVRQKVVKCHLRASLESCRDRERSLLDRASNAYQGLNDKTTRYARQLERLVEVHQATHAIYVDELTRAERDGLV